MLYPAAYERWYFYLALLIVLIPIQVLLDSLSLYVADALFKYSALDYLRFCQYKITISKEEWLLTNAVLDVSLDKAFRSIDAMCFSDQFYYCVGADGWGGVLALVGFQIITQNNYNLFSDPWTALLMALMFLIGRIGRSVCRLVCVVFKVWVKKKVVEAKGFNNKLNLDNYMMREWNEFEHDSVRHSLLMSKKDWIIENLPVFVSKDQFKEDNGFLIKVQKRLEDIIRKEEIEVIRKNLIEKNTYVRGDDVGAQGQRAR